MIGKLQNVSINKSYDAFRRLRNQAAQKIIEVSHFEISQSKYVDKTPAGFETDSPVQLPALDKENDHTLDLLTPYEV